MARTKIPVAIRMAPEIKAAAERRAKADRRSLAAYLEWLVLEDAERRPLPAHPETEWGEARGKESW